MNRLERLELIDRIGRELQQRMSYSDIDIYLKGFKINLEKETSNVNSKWVYVKELLADVEDEIIFKIANELELDYNLEDKNKEGEYLETDFWKKGYFKLFLSHISDYKKKMSILQQSLLNYGISSFVAHEDITPTKEWQLEIEKALFTMDALVAILTPEFNKSRWTDQEVGVAVGRDILIIPIKKGMDPYGFIGKYQGFQGSGKKVSEVAKGIFNIIIKNSKTKNKMISALTEQLLFSRSKPIAEKKISLIEKIDEVPLKYLEKIQENATNNEVIRKSDNLIDRLNIIMEDYEINKIDIYEEEESYTDFEVPF